MADKLIQKDGASNFPIKDIIHEVVLISYGREFQI